MTLDAGVAAVRQASRTMVRELGLLSLRYAETGLSGSQCHALIEIDIHRELSPGRLAELLCLDRSTVTRLVQSLKAEGWIVANRNESDGRMQRLSLTEAGRAKAAEIHEVSNSQVKSALRLLPEEDRLRAIHGMELYGRALQRARRRQGVTLATIVAADDRPLAALIREAMSEYGVLGPGTAHDDAELDALHAAYTRPRHVYYVLKRDGMVVGGGGIGPLEGGSRDTCELRKMYLKPEVRGLGLGAELLQACLSAAKSLLYRRCYLETMSHMREARALYERAGFSQCEEPQGQTGHWTCDAWYVKEL